MKKLFLPLLAAVMLFTACNDAADTSVDADKTADSTNLSQEEKEERNKRVALESVTAISNHNVDEALKNVTPDAVDYGDGSGPPVKNIDSIKAGMRAYLAAFPDYKAENLEAVADGNYVYVSGDWSGTFKNDFMGIKATNKQFKVKDVDIFKFNDEGKLIEHRAILPFSYVWQQVGVKQ